MEIKPLQKRIAELEERVSTLEAQRTAAMKYCGIWEATRQYDEGNTATHAGGIWYANTRTTQKPGNGSGDWTLACKSGDRR